MTVMKDPVQKRLSGHCDVALLLKLAAQRIDRVLTDLNAATRQVPARDVAVLHQKDPALRIEHHGPHTESHGARKPPVEMNAAADDRLEFNSEAGLLHRDHVYTACIDLLLLSKQAMCAAGKALRVGHCS